MAKYSISYQRKLVPDAFHGTSLVNAGKIVAMKKFVAMDGVDSYFGTGIYFYEGSKWHAEMWAQRKFGTGNKIAVLQAVIDLGKCLDLHNQEHKEFMREIKKGLTEAGISDVTDALVINFITGRYTQIDSVRGTYLNPKYRIGEGLEKIFDGSRFFEYSHLIICVKNNLRILNFVLI